MVDKDAMFDDLSRKFPAGNYSNFCNKMGVGYNEAKTMLTRCKENYTEALRDLLAQWDQRMKGVSRAQLETALIDADVGGLCSIVKKHYDDAATPSGGGDGAVQGDRNQHIHNQAAAPEAGHVKQIGSPNTPAASEEVNDDVVHSGGDGVKNLSGKAAVVRQRDIAATAPMEDDDDDGDVVYGGRGPTQSQAQLQPVAAAKPIDESHGRPERPVERLDGLVRSNPGVVDSPGGARGGDPTSNIKLERTTETKDGDKSTTTFIWTGATKEQITLFGIGILCVAVIGLFIYHRRKN